MVNAALRRRMIYLASPYSHPDPAVREQRFREEEILFAVEHGKPVKYEGT